VNLNMSDWHHPRQPPIMTMQPRPPVPQPSGSNICRVEPQVPEPSLFLQSSSLILHQPPPPGIPSHPSSSTNNVAPSGFTQPLSTQHPRPLMTPPQPHCPPVHHLKPQTDLSRQFQQSEATLYLNGSGQNVQNSLNRKVQWSDQRVEDASKQRLQFPGMTEQAKIAHFTPSPKQQTPIRPSPHPFLPTTATSNSPTPIQISNLKQTPIRPNNPPHSPITSVSHESLSMNESPASQAPVLSSSALAGEVHPEVLAVLNWQNQQLYKLQDQVSKLLAASPIGNNRSNITQSPTMINTSDAGCSPILLRKTVNSVSTNTSDNWIRDHQTFPQRVSNQFIPTGADEESLVNVTRSDMDLESSIGGTVSQPPNTNQNVLISSAPVDSHQSSVSSLATPEKFSRPDMLSEGSPVLGESVSMYQEQEMYIDIMDRVRRLLSKEEPEVANPDQYQKENISPNQNISDERKIDPGVVSDANNVKNVEHKKEDEPDPTAATWDRLKQLGVSFIAPGDLANGSRENSVWIPQAKLPSMSMSSYETDQSLAINNMAMKYLTDAELTKLAAMHQNREKTNQGVKPTDLSMASKQFLAKYGLQNDNEQSNNVQTRPRDNNHQNQMMTDEGRNAPFLLKQRASVPSPQQGRTPITATKPSAPMLHHRTPNPLQVFPQTTPKQVPASSAAPAVKQFDRVLDISAIRQQSTLL